MKKNKITHIITGLNMGGAEIMLYELLSNMDKKIFDAEVISLTDIGHIGKKIQSLGIKVRALNMARFKIPNPFVLFQLAHRLKKSNASIVQTWMYHADLIGGIAARLAGKMPVVWGIHNTNLIPGQSARSTIWIAKICAKISRIIPHLIICCSEASKKIHGELGYDMEKMTVIPNGFDLKKFKPDPNSRLLVRKELGLDENSILIGLIARFNPQKDHHNFIQAASILNSQAKNVHFLLCGDGIDENNNKLISWIEKFDLSDNFHLLGRRDDNERLMASLDILAVSSSFGEAFPLVIGEAMACEIPCVVTDVGDSALMVGDTGKVVPSKSPEVLAMAWKDLIEIGREKRILLGKLARKHIEDNFSIEAVVARYEEKYRKVITTIQKL